MPEIFVRFFVTKNPLGDLKEAAMLNQSRRP